MLKTAKLLVLRGGKAAGLFHASEQWRRKRGQDLLILCYHGLALVDEDRWAPGLYMDGASFRRRLEVLRDGGYNVLPLGEALERLQKNDLPPRSIVITFDDGSYDFYAIAYPMLQEFGFPATVYLTTYYCRHQMPVFDTLCWYLLWKSVGKKVDLDGLLPDGEVFAINTAAEGYSLYRNRIYKYVREAGLSASAKDEWAEELARRLGIDYTEIRSRRLLHLMTPQEVREISGNGIDLQLHTHRHRTPRDRALFLRELEDNVREIQDMTGGVSRPVHFCYPSGDYTPIFFPWLEEAGIRSATTCERGFVTSSSEPFLLPRLLDTPALSVLEFEGWLSGFSAMLPAR